MESEMLSMWGAEDVEPCELDVWDMGCWVNGRLSVWGVKDVGYSACDMFEMWDLGDLGCYGC